MARAWHWIKSRDANRLLASGLLACLLAGTILVLYVATITVGAAALGDPLYPDLRPRWWLHLAAGGLLAVTLRPVFIWLRGHVHDLVYAQHDNPYRLLAKVNQELQSMTSPQSTLPILASAIAGALHLPYVALETTASTPPLQVAHGLPPAGAALHRLPVLYLGKPVGELVASMRTQGRSLSASDISVLSEVALQLGIALRAAQLTADLQATRARLVTAREEERRRIRNDLHDGLAPTLSAVQLQLGALGKLALTHPDQAQAMARTLAEQMRAATAEIRQLVYNLRPPMLDELGLAGAIRHFPIQDSALLFEVRAPETLLPISAAVEVAAYLIAREALHNVVRHAGATTCRVEIAVGDDVLIVCVADDGCGLPAGASAGVGFSSMRERAAEVDGTLLIEPAPGGGTQVVARLPLGH